MPASRINLWDKTRAQLRVRSKFKKTLGYRLNLRRPQTYCEKIQWCKFYHNHLSDYVTTRADKITVRDVVARLGYSKILLQHYGGWKSAREINWNTLPKQFVLKINNASGPKYRWFIQDKTQVDLSHIGMTVDMRLSKKYGIELGEFHYQASPSQVFAEAYLYEPGGLKDYKFYCFAGEVEFFSVEKKNIKGGEMRAYYNKDWSVADVSFVDDVPPPNTPFDKPKNFSEMLLIATKLSEGYPHVRVDLYNVDGVIYFGELTYVPESGFTKWQPLELDYYYGNKIDLSLLK